MKIDLTKERPNVATTLGMYDRSHDDLLEIVDTNPNDDGSMRVTVRELIGHHCWVGGLPVRRMRRLARRVVENPRSSHLVRRFFADGCEHLTFTVA